MIANERQYWITSAAAHEFEEALDRLDTVEVHRPAALRRIMREAIQSQLEELREQLAEVVDVVRAARTRLLESLEPQPAALGSR